MTSNKTYKSSTKQRLWTSILLVILALVAITAATAAWFSITLRTNVRSMNLDVTSGTSVRFDLNPHAKFEDYVNTLGFDQIAERIQADYGFRVESKPLEPLTTSDYRTFRYEDGSVSDSKRGEYLEFKLHFMSKKDTTLHLTSEGGRTSEEAGTLITSKNPGVVRAMRISFTADGKTWVYDPALGNTALNVGGARVFGLPEPSNMVLNANNAMFDLKAEQNKEVLVHIWLEGTDEACTDDLRGADYNISLRFEIDPATENDE